MIPFAAVLLAGGRSRRMGRDKALLPLPDGRRLWERQLDVLRALEPAALFVSGPRREGFPAGLVCLEDETPEQGPLGGLATALGAAGTLPWLVALAVDMPTMTSGFLRDLLSRAEAWRGVVPFHANTGFYEPLAAVYPVGCLPVARECLQKGQRSMQGFVRNSGELLVPMTINSAEESLFQNWNEPTALPEGD